jgi:hypothetical protein
VLSSINGYILCVKPIEISANKKMSIMLSIVVATLLIVTSTICYQLLAFVWIIIIIFFPAGEIIYSFTILTTSSSSALQWLHGESCLFQLTHILNILSLLCVWILQLLAY